MSEEFEMSGNDSGWLGVFLHLEESDTVRTVTQRSSDDRGEVVYVGLKPYETVQLQFVAGRERREYRVVATEDGSFVLNVPECLVKQNPGGGPDMQVGEAPVSIEIEATEVTEQDNE